jgi:hypothetical protein
MKPKHQIITARPFSCQVVTFTSNQLDLENALYIGFLGSWE